MLGSDLSPGIEDFFLCTDSMLKKRLNFAAQLSPGWSDEKVVFLQSEGGGCDIWISILNAIGIDVQIGVNGLNADEKILLLVQAAVWRRDLAKTDYIRGRFPNATLCILSGICRFNNGWPNDLNPFFDDARSVLQAAGISFFSVQGEQYDAVQKKLITSI